jgi:hypothetical protein
MVTARAFAATVVVGVLSSILKARSSSTRADRQGAEPGAPALISMPRLFDLVSMALSKRRGDAPIASFERELYLHIDTHGDR